MGKRLPPLPSIGLQQAGANGLPGSMPPNSDAEVVAVHGTPPNADSRARARTTATELGARNAPPPKKKASKRHVGEGSGRMRSSENHDPDELLADSLLADVSDGPQPVRLARGNAGQSPSKHSRQASGRALSPQRLSSADGEDEITYLSEEQLMEQILETTHEATARIR